MELNLPFNGLARYKSASQRARVGTESWGAANLFCPACESPRLRSEPQGTAAIDYVCPSCASAFQLKSQSRALARKIVDAAYSEMRRAILGDGTPNLFVLHYDLTAWSVRTLILIPRFAFALSALERRPPLAPTARRAGWVGCNIVLDRIPLDARIPIIQEGRVQPKQTVREAYQHLRPLETIKVEKRGWTLDVLNTVRALNKREFELADIYRDASRLAKLHPDNRHVLPKIRQQLQILRDLGLLEFLGGGSYRLT
ncbi:MAG TPA: DpnI domain-containing protein [Verrucomicrobiae bacterium]|nr:DpnI domain-containing protein [Verrucomicrobiae bacterium]